MSTRTHLAVLAAVLLLPACARPKVEQTETKPAPPPDAAAVRQQLEAVNLTIIKAWEGNDTANASSAYTPDAVVMMPNEAAWVGAEKVHAGLVGLLANYAMKDVKLTTGDVMVSGDLAVETGAYDWTLVPKKGKGVHDQGKYLTVWKQQADGSWKIVRDMTNSDLPAK